MGACHFPNDNAFSELEKINPIKMYVLYEGRHYAIRERGIVDICSNQVLLDKVITESEQRNIKLQKVDFKAEKERLEREIERRQGDLFR